MNVRQLERRQAAAASRVEKLTAQLREARERKTQIASQLKEARTASKSPSKSGGSKRRKR